MLFILLMCKFSAKTPFQCYESPTKTLDAFFRTTFPNKKTLDYVIKPK